MKPLSIRSSLTVWFVGLTGLLLVAFSSTLYLSVRDTLVTEFDARLQTRAEALVAVCEWEGSRHDVEFEMSPQMAAEFTRPESVRGIEVRTWPEGKVLHASGIPLAAPPAEVDSGVTTGPFAPAGPEAMRVCTVLTHMPTVRSGESPPAVLARVVESFRPVSDQLVRVRGIILLLTVIAAGVVAAFGLFLSRRFVRPLQDLGAAAASVKPDTRPRMPRRGSGDEVDRLAGVLDRTFASLAEALERKTRFTADAAHELRNPLSVIRNAAEVALRSERSEEEVRQFLIDILDTSKRMGGVVESLLTLARMDSTSVRLQMENVDLVQLVEEAIAGLAEGRDRIVLDNGADATSIHGDRGLLRVLVDNLIANAIRHSEGCSVDVVVTEAEGGMALHVRDYGPGVPADAREDVFLRFFRAKAPAVHEGAGLGLSIVAEIARAHGASYRMDDASPGARITIVFPVPDAERRSS